jgi:hypothetical protein
MHNDGSLRVFEYRTFHRSLVCTDEPLTVPSEQTGGSSIATTWHFQSPVLWSPLPEFKPRLKAVPIVSTKPSHHWLAWTIRLS